MFPYACKYVLSVDNGDSIAHGEMLRKYVKQEKLHFSVRKSYKMKEKEKNVTLHVTFC